MPAPDFVVDLWKLRATLDRHELTTIVDAYVQAVKNEEPQLLALWEYGNTVDEGGVLALAISRSTGMSSRQVAALFKEARLLA